MLFLSLHQPSSWTASDAAIQPVTNYGFALVLASACVGGVLHGVAMALRKYYGVGHSQYWLEWKWWTGALCDAVAGCMIWPAIPFVAVHVLAPLIIVVQLSSSYILGLYFFKENATLQHNIGLAFAITGVIGISMSTSSHATPFPIAEFWPAWMAPHFLVANMISCAFLAGSFAFLHRSTFWALAAAVMEGVQYICSRTIVDSILDYHLLFLQQPAVVFAILIKCCCIASILHFQQQGLESDLSSFAGIFCVSCTFFMCVYGTTFFGEEMRSSFVFAASGLFTLVGIWLLNQTEKVEANSEDATKSITDVEAKDDESIYEGAEQSVYGSC